MPYCPKCKAEYIEGYAVCADCDILLIDSPPINEKVSMQLKDVFIFDDTPAFLCTVENDNAANMIESILRSYSIPVIRKRLGEGDNLAIYMGTSFQAVDIWVPEKTLATAEDILSSEPDLGEYEDSNRDDEFSELKEAQLRKSRLSALIFVVPFVVLVTAAVLSILLSLSDYYIDRILLFDSRQEEIRTLLNRGVDYIVAKENEKAMISFEEVRKLDEFNQKALEYEAFLDSDEQIQSSLLEGIDNTFNNDYRPHLNISYLMAKGESLYDDMIMFIVEGNMNLLNQKPDEAIKCYESALLKEMPVHQDYFYQYAAEKLIYLYVEVKPNDKNMRKGFEVAAKLLDLAPQNEYALYNYGLSFISLDEKYPVKAYGYFTKILNNNPDYAKAIYMRGYCILEIENPSEDLIMDSLDDLTEMISKNESLICNYKQDISIGLEKSDEYLFNQNTVSTHAQRINYAYNELIKTYELRGRLNEMLGNEKATDYDLQRCDEIKTLIMQ